MRKLLITWQDPNGFPRQHLTEECKTLADLLEMLGKNSIDPKQVVNLRPAYYGDRDFPSLSTPL